LGFGAAWRLWYSDPSQKAVERWVIVLPFLCWVVGLPIKLVAVEAVRGGNPVLGPAGTWALGICWIVICFGVKGVAIYADRHWGLRDRDGKIVSFRKIFQMRFCSLEGFGMMLEDPAKEYDLNKSFIKPLPVAEPIGVDIKWNHAHDVSDQEKVSQVSLEMAFRRSGTTGSFSSGLEHIIKNHSVRIQHAHLM